MMTQPRVHPSILLISLLTSILLLLTHPPLPLPMPVRSPELLLPSATAWRTWLSRNHNTHGPIYVVINRSVPPVGLTTLTPSEALDEALCFGWIDSGGGRRDSTLHHLRFGPRRAPGKSASSVRNREHVARLEEQGHLAPPGKEVVRLAKESGMWEAAYSSTPPSDLLDAVDDAGVRDHWEERLKGERYTWCVRLGSTPWGSEVRRRKIEGILRELGAEVDVADKRAGSKASSGKVKTSYNRAPSSVSRSDIPLSITTPAKRKRERDKPHDTTDTASPLRRSSRGRDAPRTNHNL